MPLPPECGAWWSWPGHRLPPARQDPTAADRSGQGDGAGTETLASCREAPSWSGVLTGMRPSRVGPRLRRTRCGCAGVRPRPPGSGQGVGWAAGCRVSGCAALGVSVTCPLPSAPPCFSLPPRPVPGGDPSSSCFAPLSVWVPPRRRQPRAVSECPSVQSGLGECLWAPLPATWTPGPRSCLPATPGTLPSASVGRKSPAPGWGPDAGPEPRALEPVGPCSGRPWALAAQEPLATWGCFSFTKCREPGPRLSGLGTPWVMRLGPVSVQRVLKAAKLAGVCSKLGPFEGVGGRDHPPVVLFPWTEPPGAGGWGPRAGLRSPGRVSTRLPSPAVVGLWLT